MEKETGSEEEINRFYTWLEDSALSLAFIAWLVVLIFAADAYELAHHVCPVPEPEIITEYVEIEVEVPAPPAAYEAVVTAMTEEEYHLMAKVVAAEAGNQSFTGQRAVAEVICNRVLDARFPDNVTDVIYQKNQFSVAKNLHKVEPTQEHYDAVTATLQCVEPVMPKEVLFFAPVDMKRPLYERIGGHRFYYAE